MKRLALPIAGLFVGLALAGCQSAEGPTPMAPSLSPTVEETTEASTSVQVYGGVGLGPGAIIPNLPAEGQCRGHSEYADLVEGAQVSVLDSTGKVVGIGELSAGKLVDPDCTWTFTIDVPAGGGFYKASVLGWESQLVAESDLASTSLVIAPAGQRG